MARHDVVYFSGIRSIGKDVLIVAEKRTLFDDVVRDADVANAERFLVLGLKEVADGDIGSTSIRLHGLKDALAMGNMFGDVLEKKFGHDMGEEILTTFLQAAVLALHGQGMPAKEIRD